MRLPPMDGPARNVDMRELAALGIPVRPLAELIPTCGDRVGYWFFCGCDIVILSHCPERAPCTAGDEMIS